MRYDDNLTTERPTFVTHLECSATGERYPADALHNLSRAGKPLLVRYDLTGVRQAMTKDAWAFLWRFIEPGTRPLADVLWQQRYDVDTRLDKFLSFLKETMPKSPT